MLKKISKRFSQGTLPYSDTSTGHYSDNKQSFGIYEVACDWG